MSAAEQPQQHASTARHRRETRLGIYLPLGLFTLALAGVILLVIAAYAAPEKRWGISLIADMLLTVLVLCPSVLCLGIIAMGFAVAAFKIGVLHGALAKPLRRAQNATKTASKRLEGTTNAINERTIGVSARMVFLSKLLNTFDEPADEAEDESHG